MLRAPSSPAEVLIVVALATGALAVGVIATGVLAEGEAEGDASLSMLVERFQDRTDGRAERLTANSLSGEVASNLVPVAHTFKWRFFDTANLLRHWAAGVEPAPCGRVERARHLAGHHGPVVQPAEPWVRDRYGRKERLCVRVVGTGIERIALGYLHDLSQVHHGHPVAHLAHDGEVVGDEQVGEAEPAPGGR